MYFHSTILNIVSKLCHLYEKSRRETIMYKTNSSSVVFKKNGIIDTE